MKLNSEAKATLLSGVERTYNGYAALDCSETAKIFKGSSLSDFTRQMIHEGKMQATVHIGNTDYKIALKKIDTDTYSIEIDPKKPHSLMTYEDIENPNNEEQVVALLASQSIEIDLNKPHPYITIDNHDKSAPIRVGGDKLQLYRTHLVTLHKIHERIKADEDISNLLVALATGSGKTFVQALWLVSLHSAGMKGFFGVPGRLEDQFFSDLKRLLPDSFVEEKIGRLGDPNRQEGFLGQDKDIVVGDAFKTLDEHFGQLDSYNPQEVMLSFDEQHLLMRVERRRLRLIDLSERFLSCFLTATPNEETYQLCGKNPIATMSNKQKEEAKQGKVPKIATITAKSASDKNANTEGFFNRLKRRFNIFISDAIQKQPTSAAIQVMDDLPFMTQAVNGKTQQSVRRKMLFIVDDPDSLINLCHRVNEPASREVYENGNLYSRKEIGELLLIQDVDSALYDEEMEARGEGSKAKQAIDAHLKATIYHNMIDHVLTDALGMNLLELNQLRQQNPDLLRLLALLRFGVKEISDLSVTENQLLTKNQIDVKKIGQADLTQQHYEQSLLKKIDGEGAKEISHLLAGIATNLKTQFNGNKYLPSSIDHYLTNDPTDEKMAVFILRNIEDRFNQYAQKHLVLCVMDDMRSKDLPIEHDAKGNPRPFWGMTSETYPLYDESGVRSEKAKTRPLKSIEALNPEVTETRFHPNYADITETQADMYFKLGFVGAYISNRKTEGFSDLNLHTVISVCNFGGQRLNGPDKVLQGLGRNRGLDETVEPLFVHALGNGQSSPFSLKNLDKDDYYKEYFQGMNTFREAYLKLLGDKLAEDIIAEYHAGVEPDESFDTNVFRKKVMHMIREDLREINSLNNHQINISRAQLGKVLAQAQKRLDEHLQNVEAPNRLSGVVNFLGNLMNAAASIYFWFSQRGTKSEFNQAMKNNNHQPDKIYEKILSNTSFKQLSKKMFVAAEIQSLVSHQRDVMKALIEKYPKKYLMPDAKKKAIEYETSTLKPILLKFVKEDHQEIAANALNKHPDLLGFLHRNEKLFEKLSSDDISEKEVKETLVQLFQQFEETRDINESAFIDTINLGKALREKLQQGPAQLLDDEICTEISEGISPNFIEALKTKMLPLLMPEDVEKLKNGLTIEVGQQFCKVVLQGHGKFLRGEEGGIDISDSKALFALFNQALGVNAIQNPEELAKQYVESMSKLHQTLEESPVEAMNAEKFGQLKHHFKKSLIPAMINLCPFDQRVAIHNQITDEAIEELIKKDSLNLQSMQEKGDAPETIANFVLSKLTKSVINSAQSPATVEEQVSQSMKTALAEKQKVTFTNAYALGKAVVFAGLPSLFGKNGFIEATKKTYAANLVLDKNFLKAFSTLVPLDQYQTLEQKLQQDPSLSEAIASKLLALGEEAQDPQKLVAAVSDASEIPMDFIADNAESAQEQINQMFAQKDTNPSALLKTDVIEQLSKPTKKTLIPLLAKFIQDDSLRQQFISHCQTIPDGALFDFMVVNQESFQALESDDFTIMKPHLIKIFNGLNAIGPSETKLLDFTPEQLRSLTQFIDEQLESLQDMTEIEVLSEYLTTTQFIDVLQLAYNQTDLKTIVDILSDPNKRRDIAFKLKMADGNIDSLDDLFHQHAPDVKQLDTRLDECTEFLNSLAPEEHSPLKLLDKAQLNPLIEQRLLKPLTHPLIKDQFSITIGLFEQKELETLLDAMYGFNKPISAEKLIEFNQLLQKGDTQQIAEQFLLKDYDDFDSLPLKHVFQVAFDLHQEMIKCHCHFNQHGMRGEIVSETYGNNPGHVTPNAIQPKIYDLLSPGVKKIHMESDSEVLNMSRRLSYLRSLQLAFPDANELHRRNHAAEIKHIKRIRDHVIEPVRERTGRYGLTNWFINLRDAITSGIKFVFGKIASFFKGIFASNDNKDQPVKKVSKKQHDRHEALAFISAINKLRKLTKQEARSPDSPEEVVDKLLTTHQAASPKTKKGTEPSLSTTNVSAISIFSSSPSLRKKMKEPEPVQPPEQEIKPPSH
jgi:hypothetical protein